MPHGIQVGSGEDVCKRIIVHLNHKQHICQILFEVFGDTPLQCEKLELRTMVVFFGGHKGVATKCDGVAVPVCDSTVPNPSLEVSVSSRKDLSKSRKMSTGAI